MRSTHRVRIAQTKFCHTIREVKQMNNKDMLSSIIKTVQMGQIGIRSVRENAPDAELEEL